MRILVPLVAVSLLAAETQAIPISFFTDIDSFAGRAEDIVIAKCLGPVPDGENYDDGLYGVDVEIALVLKGGKKTGKAKIATIYPMEAGKTYLLTSLGGSAHGTDFLAVAQLAVVEVPPAFRLGDLQGRTVREQVTAVLAARRQENERHRRALENERTLLDKALSK